MQCQKDELCIQCVARIKRCFHAVVELLCIMRIAAQRELFVAKNAIGKHLRGLCDWLTSRTGQIFVELNHGEFDRVGHKDRMHPGGPERIIQCPHRG